MPNHESNINWIKLYRPLVESDLWLQERFSRGQAWVDLLLRANYKDEEKFGGDQVYTVRRGEIATKIDSLATRWGWGKSTVIEFLKALESAGMVTVKSYRSGRLRGTIITIENYLYYQDWAISKQGSRAFVKQSSQPLEISTESPNGARTKQTSKQSSTQSSNQSYLNNIKKENKGKERACAREAPPGGPDEWLLRIVARTLQKIRAENPERFEDALDEAVANYGDGIIELVEQEEVD